MLSNRMILNVARISFKLIVVNICWISIASAQTNIKSDSSKIVAKLFSQQICWNKGDIDCFMETYWQSDSLKFVGKDGITYGWEATMNRYKEKYPDQTHMGVLSFDVLEVEPLGSNTIMLIGKWGLKREVGDVGGHFTLIWKKIAGKWLIISDHTS